MRHLPVVSLSAVLIAAPLFAQSKLDKAIEKAFEQVEKGKPDDAVKTLTEAAEDSGAEGYLALARLQEHLGHLDEARAAHDRARAVATPAQRRDVLAAAGTFTLRAGTGKEALVLANQAVEEGATAATLAARSRALLRTEGAAPALKSADEAVSLDPGSAIARVARGEALFGLGRNAEAESALMEAVKLAPRSALAWSRLCRVRLALGRTKEAVEAGRKATEVDPGFGEGFALLGDALLADDPGNWGAAIAEAQQGAFVEPSNPVVQTAVGRIFDANGQADQSVAAYRRALQTDPGFAPARLALIEAELALGNRDAALAEAARAEADMPDNPQIQLLIGIDAERRGEHQKALGYLEKALAALPGNADAWALLGRAYQLTGRTNDAASAYGRAVELAPQNLSFRTTYGLALGMSGDLAAGKAQLDKVVATPGYRQPDAWANLGWIHRAMDQPTESIEAYRKALEIDPSLAQAALGLGWAYTKNKEYDQGVAWYEKAVALDPQLAADAWWGATFASIYALDLDKARDYQKRTAAAGRDASALAGYIDQIAAKMEEREAFIASLQEQQQREADEARRRNAALAAVQSKDAGARARGARDLAQYPDKGSIDSLIYLIRTDPDWNARIEAAKSLGAIGPPAKAALPHIKGILDSEPFTAPIGRPPTKEELEAEMLDGDLRKVLFAAQQRIER